MSTPRLSRDEVERLYAELGPALLAYGCCLLGDRGRAEDALHQLFLRLLSDGAGALRDQRPYLYRALRNTALNLRRGEARAQEREAKAALFEAPPGLESQALELAAALQELPDEQRQAVVLKVWGGLTFEEIAGVADVPANTAASRYRYGLARLRARLDAARQEGA
jgi:RNA polymerase sigma-70 factor (ECF subfamily)